MAIASRPFAIKIAALRRMGGYVLAAGVAQLASNAVAQTQIETVSLQDGCSNIATNEVGLLQPAAGPADYSKSAAILSGEPSKLELMRMAQSGLPIPVQPALAPCRRDSAPSETAIKPIPNLQMTPDGIFGSVPVPVGSTPFDSQWASATGKRGQRSFKALVKTTGLYAKQSVEAQLIAVNNWVNNKIAYREDHELYGKADYWASARETLRRSAGDCEDFAIVKLELLASLGIARDRMRLVVARDLVRNADHAVLVVDTDSGAFVLDNSTDKLLDARLPHDYRPIMSFSQNGKWVHGYADRPTVAALASAEADTVQAQENISTVAEAPAAVVTTLAVAEAAGVDAPEATTVEVQPAVTSVSTETLLLTVQAGS
jgi:predicted transglutaminase-like cysteine proteinase